MYLEKLIMWTLTNAQQWGCRAWSGSEGVACSPSAGPQGFDREVTWKDKPLGFSEWELVIYKVIVLAVSGDRHVYI